ncbi:hypothetical protein KBD34_02985 [Patescibacteria group bacterium]|nr:hypothetical protein [Patescibacteria group bacterium]
MSEPFQKNSYEMRGKELSFEDLSVIYGRLKDAFQRIYLERTGLSDGEELIAHLRVCFREQDEILQQWVRMLQAEPDRISHLFRTAFGSLYVVLKTGHCMRVKVNNETRYRPPSHVSEPAYRYLVQPITRRVVFLPPDQESLWRGELRLLASRDVASVTLPITSLALGVHPFEFETLPPAPAKPRKLGVAELNADGTEITLRGWEESQDTLEAFNGYSFHVGDPVREILI